MGILDNIREAADLAEWEEEMFHDCPECSANNWEKESGLLSFGLACKECGFESDIAEMGKSRQQRKTEKQRHLAIKKIERKTDHTLTPLSDSLKERVLDKVAEDWTIVEVDANKGRVVMGRPKEGGVLKHAVVGLFTFPITFGGGNIAYHEYKKRDLEKIVLREDETSEDRDAVEKLSDLKELHDEGVLTESEFEEKKAKLLGEI